MPRMRHSVRTLALACFFASLGIAQASSASDAAFYRHQARPGDTLIGLGQALLIRPSDWPQLAKLNRIEHPRHIPIGTLIRIPVALMKSKPVQGTVLAVVGNAMLNPVHGESSSVQIGAAITPGTEIRTGSDGYVTVQLADGSVLRMQSDTTTQLEGSEHYEAAGFFASRLRLIKGRLEALVSHMTGGEPRFEVKTPQALLGVRGTEFRIAVDDATHVTRGEVLDGAVAFGAATGQHQTARRLAAGYGALVGPQRTVSTPVPLPAPPDLSAVPALHERVVLRINVPALPGAALYRAQLAGDAGFQQVQGELKGSTPEFRFVGLPDGHYHLRVRVANAQGIEGPDATRQIHLKARPEAPISTQPTPGAKLRATAVAMAWAEQPEADHYRLQVTQDPSFQKVLHEDRNVRDTRYTLNLPVGNYRWRVASVRPDGDQGPFGDPQSFELRAPPPQPEPPKIDAQFMSFNWAGEPGQSFEFQLARDAAFAHLLVKRSVAEPRIQVARPDEGGRFYIRYQAFDADGFVGPFTAPQVINLPHCVQDGGGQCLLTGFGDRVISPW